MFYQVKLGKNVFFLLRKYEFEQSQTKVMFYQFIS